MSFPQEQIDELKEIAPSISLADEGGYTYIFIKDLKLPTGYEPNTVNALLCPTLTNGYQSRLFFSEKITGCAEKNWNGLLRVLDTNWFSFSWQTDSGLSLKEMLLVHIQSLRK